MRQVHLSERRRSRAHFVLGAAAAMLVPAGRCLAAGYLWVNGAGGTFSTASNWSGGPAGTFPSTASDTATFDLNSPGYTVTFSAGVTTGAARVRTDVVTFNLGTSTYNANGGISMGDAADQVGTLTLTGTSGLLNAAGASIAGAVDTTSTLNVSTGATLNLTAAANVGQNGAGTVAIVNGGHVTQTGGITLAGGAGGGVGTLTVSGAGSSLTSASAGYTIGGVGTGSMTVLGGASVTGTAVTLGNNSGSSGTAVVGGTGSSWSMSSLAVGSGGDGTFTVNNAGSVSGSGSFTFAPAGGTNATASVSGSGSSFGTTGSLVVAGSGTASLTASSAATMTDSTGTLGNSSGSSATMLVTDPGTTWTNSSGAVIGNAGSADVSVENGAHASSTTLSLGSAATGTGQLTLTGTGTLWTTTNYVTIGGNGVSAGGNGTLTIEPGATLTQTGASSVFRFHPGGVVNLNGGTLSVVSLASSGGTFNFNAGTLNITAAGTALSVSPTGALGATLALDTGQAMNVTSTVDVAATGLVVLSGGGTLSAGLLTNAGEVQLTSDLATIGGTTLSNSGLLLGDGRINASLTNNSAGEVRVSSSSDRLVFKGATNTNAGKINVLNGGTVEITNGLANNNQINLAGGVLSSGALVDNNPGATITGRGTIMTPSLNNDGQFTFSGGFTDIYGPVTGTSGSSILVTGGSTTTFYNAVTSGSGASITVAAGSAVVFLGGVSGAGTLTGAGTKYFADGSSDPATLSSTGNTVVESPAVVTTASVRENDLTVNGNLRIAPNGTSLGTSAVNTITVGGAGKFDLANNDLVVKNSTLAAIQALLSSGFAGGAWNGPGINSSAAAQDPNGLTALGYVDNSQLGASSFSGITGLDANDVLVKYTYYGDADLSGDVTLDDFTQFLDGYQHGGTTWLVGDFDYSGTVTLDDFTQFLYGYQNQGAPLGALEDMIAAANLDPASRAAMLSAVEAVPEPGAAAALGLLVRGASLIMSRRRRRSAQAS